MTKPEQDKTSADFEQLVDVFGEAARSMGYECRVEFASAEHQRAINYRHGARTALLAAFAAQQAEVARLTRELAEARVPEELQEAIRYAERLAMSLAAQHYPEVPQWRPHSGDLIGLLTQLDHMTTGLVRAAPAPGRVHKQFEYDAKKQQAADAMHLADALNEMLGAYKDVYGQMPWEHSE